VLYFHVYITCSLDSNYSIHAAVRNLKLRSISEFLNSFSAFHPTEAAQKQAFLSFLTLMQTIVISLLQQIKKIIILYLNKIIY